MDNPRPVDINFSTKDRVFWKSRKEMVKLVAKIAGDTGRGMSIGDSTTFEISKLVGVYRLVIFMTVCTASIRISGDIQLGLNFFFGQQWATVKAYTTSSPEDADVLDIGPGQYVFVSYGAGFKPHFAMNVFTDAELATIVRRIFNVDL